MPRKMKPMTLAEHQALGKELKRICRRLMEISTSVSCTYGRSKRVGKLAKRADDSAQSLRCELDNQVARDHPGTEREALLDCYYGD